MTTLVVGSLIAVASPATAAPLPTSSADQATESVIVVLADQIPSAPPSKSDLPVRAGKTRAAQQAVLSRLSGRAPTKVAHYTLGNAFSATVTAAQADALKADPAVASVVANRDVPVAPTAPVAQPATASPDVATSGAAPVNPDACGTKAHPKLEPEALQTMNVRSDDPAAKTAAQLGIDGSGVTVGYIADGINPNNVGFQRSNGTSSIVDYKDFYGDGPDAPTSGAEAFGDASAISAQGHTYDVADYANPGVVSLPGGHCYIRVLGVAPGANVVALKAGSELLPNSAILQAIDYAVTTAHVNVLNESFGANVYPDSGSRNTIELFNDQATQAGVTVTVSTGDAGTTSTIGNPSTDPNVISTGASTDSRIYEQTGYALATAFGNGRWQDDNISSLSSAGITQNGRTIDVSTPGEADWALCDASGKFSGCTSFKGTYAPIQAFGGTSQSAPLTAGVAALVIQAYSKTHGGSQPTPAVVKQIITSTAHDLGFAGDVQGTGRIDARAAVEAALNWAGANDVPKGTSPNLALSTDQLSLTGTPGTTATGSVKVTNDGSTPMTVVPSTRQYASLGTTEQSTAVKKSDPTTPYPTNAAPWNYRKVTFSVPSGTDVLDSTIRWVSGAGPADSGPVVRMSLFAPDGTYAANTRPQGGAAPANYGDVLVRHPAAGTWTAVLYTPSDKTGFHGTVFLRTNPQRALPVGSVNRGAFTLAPGASKTVSVSMPVPASGGDAVDTLALATSSGRQTAVPVIVRALVPTGKGTGTFTGTISGGNARSYSPADAFSYAFDVPQGKKDLDVSVTLAKDPGDLLEGILVDPNGETPSISTNAAPDGSAKQGLSMENTVATPVPGRWRYVVVVENPVTGKEFFQNFTGTVGFDKVRATTSSSGASTVAFTTSSAAARTFTVTVHNPGAAPIAVQADPRTTTQQQVQLAPQFAGSNLTLPQSVDDLSQIPAYLVPPDTQKFALSAASTVPAQVELSSPGGGIDLFGDLQSAQGGNTVSTATVREKAPATVGQGYWGTYVQEIGPFDDNGAPAGTSNLVAYATTLGFDRAVTTSLGDPYLAAVDPTAPAGTPVIIQPGRSATFAVTITPPKGAKGTVNGLLNVVTMPIGTAFFNTTGDVLAAIPYSYRAS